MRILNWLTVATLAVVLLLTFGEALPALFNSARGCVAWLAVGGFGHIAFDVLTYGAVFFLGTKWSKARSCKHGH